MQAVPTCSSNLLVVDSDPITLPQTAAILAGAGFEVRCAADGAAARGLVRDKSPDLCLCDLHLRTENGLELIKHLRREPGAADMAVMFVSASQRPDIIRRVHDAGGTYYLRKPVDPVVLLELIDRALTRPHVIRNRISASQAIFAPHLATGRIKAS